MSLKKQHEIENAIPQNKIDHTIYYMNLNLIKLDINIEHRVTQNAIIFMHTHFDRTRKSLRRGRSNHLIFVFFYI